MESKVMFDLDCDNNSVIKIEIKSTADLRDKVAKRFIQAIGYDSQWCEILPSGELQFTIFPIKPEELRRHAQLMSERADKLEAEVAKYTTVVEQPKS